MDVPFSKLFFFATCNQNFFNLMWQVSLYYSFIGVIYIPMFILKESMYPYIPKNKIDGVLIKKGSTILYHSIKLHILAIAISITYTVSVIMLEWGLLSQFPLLFFSLFSIAKILVSFWISRSYLTSVTSAQLQWHLSNMNVMQRI